MRATWRAAFSGEIWGSSPEPEAVTASAGIGPWPIGLAQRIGIALDAGGEILVAAGRDSRPEDEEAS